MSSRVSLTSSAEVASLSLVGQPSSDSVTIKMPYAVDVLHLPVLQTESGLLLDQLRLA